MRLECVGGGGGWDSRRVSPDSSDRSRLQQLCGCACCQLIVVTCLHQRTIWRQMSPDEVCLSVMLEAAASRPSYHPTGAAAAGHTHSERRAALILISRQRVQTSGASRSLTLCNSARRQQTIRTETSVSGEQIAHTRFLSALHSLCAVCLTFCCDSFLAPCCRCDRSHR